MSDLEHRWARLLEAARRAPASDPRPPAEDWVARIARRGLVARRAPASPPPERLAWAGLAALAAAAALVVLVWPGPITSASDALSSGISSLPRSLPRAPRLPAEARPTLPPARDALAALPRWSELTP